MSKLTDTLIAFGAIPKEVLISMKSQGLISEEQVLLHGSAPHPHDLDALVWEIENALREDHLPELLELEGEEGWVKPLDDIGWTGANQSFLRAWRSDGYVRFEYAGMRGELPKEIHWWNGSKTEMTAVSLRDVGLVRYNGTVLVQAMLSKG